MQLIMQQIRRYFIAGLLVWLPIWVTLLVLRFVIELLESGFLLIPQAYQPQNWFGLYIPGLGVVLSITIIFLTGMLVTNFLGRRLVRLGESLVGRIPMVRSIYMGTKQLVESLFSTTSESFRKVLLVEYPRKGMWSLAFQTGSNFEPIVKHTGEEMVGIFIPTTPNPTSGFFMMVPAKDAIELDMTVDQAFKFIVSLGVVPPITPDANKSKKTKKGPHARIN
jgi:uncharacterized membrane protein